MVEPTLIKPKTDDYHLKEMPAGTNPGISRDETDDQIKVNYANRFTIYDEEEKTQKSMI